MSVIHQSYVTKEIRNISEKKKITLFKMKPNLIILTVNYAFLVI